MAYKAAFFASGRGSNFLAVLKHMQDGTLAVEPAFFLSNNSTSQSIQTARENNIPAYHVSTRTEGSEEGVEKKILELVDVHAPDLLVLGGYMRKVPLKVIRSLPNRIINIHPALLPSFGGSGWYGGRVHEGVINKGCQYSGVTIHVVNEVYDEGTIIMQRATEVIPGETAEELAARVLKIEHDCLWRVVKGYAEGILRPADDGLEGIDAFRRNLLNSEF
ncbi:phosphoribosylglycinamide formyltransferase [Fibrobacterota bacterium]